MYEPLSQRILEQTRTVYDFPKAGINFFDVTTVLADGNLLSDIIESFCDRIEKLGDNIDAVVGIESRGFMFGAAICSQLKTSFVPVRKPGKLPAETYSASYDLEYGSATLELHKDAISKGDRIVIVDDLLATGGTAEATAKLVEEAGGKIVEFAFVYELAFLKGRQRLRPYPVHALVTCEE
jgi:adenine phosphoribosyltransferase